MKLGPIPRASSVSPGTMERGMIRVTLSRHVLHSLVECLVCGALRRRRLNLRERSCAER